MIVSVRRTKTKITKKKKQKNDDKRKFLTGYATIVKEKGIEVEIAEIAEIKRIAMKRKTRKQGKLLMEMMMS